MTKQRSKSGNPYKLVKPWRLVLILFIVILLLALLLKLLIGGSQPKGEAVVQEISQSSETSYVPPVGQTVSTSDISNIKNQIIGYMTSMILANPGNYPTVPDLEPEESYVEDPKPVSYVYRLVIDPGHGGNDGGNDQGKMPESVINLEIALKLRNALREKAPEIEVIMTREDDTYVSLDDRAKLANDLQADFFLSIHCNSFQDDTSVRGLETRYWIAKAEEKQELGKRSQAAAQVLLEKAAAGFGLRQRSAFKQTLEVLYSCEMPAVLMELGYLSNAEDDAALCDPEIQEQGAQAMADAVMEILSGYEPRNALDSGDDSGEDSAEDSASDSVEDSSES